jgi:hypothetical protein
MGTRQIGLVDIVHGGRVSRLRLLAPLRYLLIKHPEKRRYDILVPTLAGIVCWAGYLLIQPKPPLFGDGGLLRFARDLLIMAVPFMVGALAAVSMGAPGKHLDRRPIGVELSLDGEVLTLRQFLCFLLGYLSLLGMATLFAVVGASLLRDTVSAWTLHFHTARYLVVAGGSLVLSLLLSYLSVTVLWSLYFLTDIANHKVGAEDSAL